LFPTIKEKLKDIQMADEEDLFYWLQDILNSISRKELDQIFGTWINRFMIVSRGNGAYMSWRINHSQGYSYFNHDIRLAQRLTDHRIRAPPQFPDHDRKILMSTNNCRALSIKTRFKNMLLKNSITDSRISCLN
jgi:hypothetical protein